MEKRGWIGRLPLFLLGGMLGLPMVAAASPLSTIGGFIKQVFSPIVNVWGTGDFLFWAKVLVWVLVFAILYAVITWLRRGWSANIRRVIAGIVALISVIPLTNEVLRALFETYGIIVSSFLIFAPIVGLLYLTYYVPARGEGEGEHRPTRLVYALRAILFYILGAVIESVVSGGAATGTFSAQLGTIGTFAVGVCGLLFLWNVLWMILGPDNADAAGDAAHGAAEGIGDWFRNLFQPARPAGPPPDGVLVGQIQAVCISINNFNRSVFGGGGGFFRRAGIGPYRQLGNVLLTDLQLAFRNGDIAALGRLAGDNRQWLDAAAAARGLRHAIEDVLGRIAANPALATLPLRYQRDLQRCVRRWTLDYTLFQEYNIRYLHNYINLSGPVTPL